MQFYHEFTDRSKTHSTGNIITVFEQSRTKSSQDIISYEALVRSYPYPLSPNQNTIEPNGAVTHGTISEHYLQTRCKRVSVREAQHIHPSLFTVLEDWEVIEAQQLEQKKKASLLLLGSLLVSIALLLAFLLLHQRRRHSSQ